MAKILVVEDEDALRMSIRKMLKRAGHEVIEALDVPTARKEAGTDEFDVVLTDVNLGDESGLDLIKELRGDGFGGAIGVMTAFGTIEIAVEAMQLGADDFLQKPLKLEELPVQLEKWIENRRKARRLELYERMEQTREEESPVIGESPAWTGTLAVAKRLASVPMSQSGIAGGTLPCILLLGETGAGKGVLARYIHSQTPEVLEARQTSAPASIPFVHVNCSALPATLVESELFGHEKGAFTDAREARQGLFEMADGGTIFLDEISEMPIELQAKLLIVVEQGTFRRVGGSRDRSVRARVIAASNLDLEKRAEEGAFRRDLFYRLNALTINIPPLRDREDDAVRVAEQLLERFGRQYSRQDLSLSDASRTSIRQHDWPGNVRELVNALQRAVMLATESEISPTDLGLDSRRLARTVENHHSSPIVVGSNGLPKFDFSANTPTADDVERALIRQAIEHTHGNVSRAAKLIGMTRAGMRYRIERYQLDEFVKEASQR